MRIRVPIPRQWDDLEKENLARKGEEDPRFYNFIVDDQNTFHIFPDYEDEGNPNTGDDLGFIEIPKENSILSDLTNMCYFWKLTVDWARKRIQFIDTNHKGMKMSLKRPKMVFFYIRDRFYSKLDII